MKKQIVIFLMVLMMLVPGMIVAQPTVTNVPHELTYGGVFDKVSDRFGNEFNLTDVSLYSARPFGATTSITTVPTVSCIAGPFKLFFAPTSTVFVLGASSSSAQTILCEVFSNIGGLISSTIPPGSINIYCDDIISTSLLGNASPVFSYQYLPPTGTPGFIDGQIYKALVTGIDPYSLIPIGTFTNSLPSNDFYHGFVTANPNATWNFNMGITNIANNEYDFYTVMLHEATHALGFLSLIGPAGYSIFGQANNYFARYDMFLQDANNTPLLTPTVTTGCPNLYLNFNFSSLTPTNAISQAVCTSTNSDVTTCSVAAKYSSANVTATVYTPYCFEPGSSLSHFEDMCSWAPTFTTACPNTPPGYNNLYYLMANFSNTGPCYVKRYLKEEERKVLCDLGYSLTSLSYTSNAAGAPHTYSFNCTPTGTIVGIDDGYSAGVYTFSTTTTLFTVPLASLVANDLPSTGSVSCLQLLVGAQGTSFNTSGPNLNVTSTLGSGLVVLKYYPQNANGFGNPTYVYIYFYPGQCLASNSCNMVQNPGFETQATGSLPCGGVQAGGPYQITCWKPYQYISTILVNSCATSLGAIHNVPYGSFNGAVGNDSYLVLLTTNGNSTTSALSNSLSSTLINGATYKISFWVKNASGTFTGVPVNINSDPAIITVATNSLVPNTPSVNFPAGLVSLTTFTVNASNSWNYVTGTFVFPVIPGGTELVIGLDNAQLSVMTGTPHMEVLIDEVNLVPVPSPTFALPQTTICSTASYTNLAQYTSTFSGTGVFSGPGVTYSGGQYNFNPAGMLLVSYPIAFTYTDAVAGCVNTIWQNVFLKPTVGISSSGSTTVCARSAESVTIVANQTTTLAGISFSWQPGSLSGPSQGVSPTVTTVYTVTAFNSSFCPASETLAVNVFTNCCGLGTLTPFTQTVVTTATLSGQTLIASDFTVQPGNSLALYYDYQCTANSRITVASTASLYIYSAHLYACGDQMWKGITVQDGGYLMAKNAPGDLDNLIEDAEKAIEVSNYTTTSLSILDITNTTFNKNFIDINISNYQQASTTYSNVFNIRNSVFTCRNFYFNSVTWPYTSTADLRSAGNPTTGLDSPYLNSSTAATLLAPYAGQTSSIAINFSTVGISTGTVYYGIGLGSATASEFNLFDNHHSFIYGNSSNLSCINSVFQNTKYSSGVPGSGSAIYVTTPSANSNLNNKIDFNGVNQNVGNRFWNCHRGVEGKNIYHFEIENAIFRSTQSTATGTVFSQGNTGIALNTNRFRYWVLNNEFTNINTGVIIPITAGASTMAQTSSLTPAYGVFAGNLTIQQNTFAIGTGTANYMNQAIEITSNFQNTWAMLANPNIAPSIVGTFIQDNNIREVYRGIKVSGMRSFPTWITDNHITMLEDPAGNAQRGIELNTCITNATTYGRHRITANSLKSVGTNTWTNTNTSLVYCGSNMGPGLQSPSVTCNDVSESYNGFVFDSQNQGTMWYGNDMTNLVRGMVLTNTAVIGQQGGSILGTGNAWNGTWAGANYGIYTSSSVASLSVLWATPTNTPPNLSGFPNPGTSYAVMGLSVTSGGSDFHCYAPTGKSAKPFIPANADYDDDKFLYIAQKALYDFLQANDSIRNADALLSTFFSNFASTSIGAFGDIETNLSLGDFSAAGTILAGITATSSVESNYVDYYTLYLSYANNAFEPTNDGDENDLTTLASLCPGTDGACVYQARALYNSVFNSATAYPVCSGSGARIASPHGSDEKMKIWSVKLYPNPATNRVNIISNIEDEILNIVINDLSGRILLRQDLKFSGFIVNLELGLISGVYLVTITNSNHETIIKKLVINK